MERASPLSICPPKGDEDDDWAGEERKNKKVMVELGTGFYAEKNFSDAIEFIDRKVGLISKNSENLLKVIQATKKNVENINISMQGKLMQIRARQEGLKHQAANA